MLRDKEIDNIYNFDSLEHYPLWFRKKKNPFILNSFLIDIFTVFNFIVLLAPSSLSFSVTCKKYMGGKLAQHRYIILCRVKLLPITFKQPTPTPTSLHPSFSPVSCHLRKNIINRKIWKQCTLESKRVNHNLELCHIWCLAHTYRDSVTGLLTW